MATLNSAPFAISAPQSNTSLRTVAELTIGFAAIMVVLWLPTRQQLIFGPIALLGPLILVLLQRPTLRELGLHWRGTVSSLWILPAAAVVAVAGILVARAAGTFHELYKPDLAHVGGYVLWTIYQQFLLQDLLHAPPDARAENGCGPLHSRPYYSRLRTCPTSPSPWRLWFGEPSRAPCSAVTAA